MTKYITKFCPFLMLFALGCSSTKSNNDHILTAQNTKLYGFKFDTYKAAGEYYYIIEGDHDPEREPVYIELNNLENLFRTNILNPRLTIFTKIQRPGGPLVKVCGPISAVGRDELWYYEVQDYRPTWCGLDAPFTVEDKAFLGKMFGCILWLKVGPGDFILYDFGRADGIEKAGVWVCVNCYIASPGFQFVWEFASLVNGKSIYFEQEPCVDDPGMAQFPKISKRWQGQSGFYSEGDFPDLQSCYPDLGETLQTDANMPVAPTPAPPPPTTPSASRL